MNTTSIESLPVAKLTAEHWETWNALRTANSSLSSPYFMPEFTQAIAELRNDVEVAVIREAEQTVGLLPFQRAAHEIGRPVGGPLSDFQAVIGRPDLVIDPLAIVRGCRLARWDFDHLLVSQQGFLPHHVAVEPSPYLDVRGGYDAYVERRVRTNNDELKQAARRRRKIERELGPVRFEMQVRDDAVLETLFRWKSDQYRLTGYTDVFAFDWTRKLLAALLAGKHQPLDGVLSAMYAGDRLIAVHYGMQAAGVLHSWFPAYDPELAKYSPGILLLVDAIRAAESNGIARIDLGKGSQVYKLRLMTGLDEVAEGSVNQSALAGMLRRRCRAAKQWVKNSRFQPTLEQPARWLRHWREQALFD